MKKKVITGIAVGLALLFVCSTAYSWNYATHAYIAAKIGKMLPLANCNEMYGLMAPDIFNFEFSLMADMNLRGYTHGIPGDPYVPGGSWDEHFMRVWQKAPWGLKRNIAFGYIAHNDAWGADFVAHWQANPWVPAQPIPYYNQPPGYIILLAVALDQNLENQGIWGQLGLPLTLDDRMMFCHNLIEYAGDLVVKRADPLIGKKLILACALRTPEFKCLLKSAFPHYSPDGNTDYYALIDSDEPAYRKMLMQYGLILLQPENTAIEMLANQLADLAIDYLEFINNLSPGTLDILKPQLVEFGKATLAGSIEVCLAGGYMDEINFITIPWVKQQLAAHGVSY
jgi:hypothetical protein